MLCQVAHFSHSLCSWTVLLSRLRFRSGAQTRTGYQETVQATVLQLRQCCHRPCSPQICRGTTGPLHENDSTPSSAQAVRQECYAKNGGVPCRHQVCVHHGSRPVLRKFVIKCLENKKSCFSCLVCLHGSCIATT